MIDKIEELVTDVGALRAGYVVRDGYVFAMMKTPSVFDALVVRSPPDATGGSSMFGFSQRTLDEHIQLINEYQLKKSIIICNDLSFILQCPSLKKIAIYPDNNSGNNFDYSPLYQMPNILELHCCTTYGHNDCFHTTVDYSKVNGLLSIAAAGTDQVGYNLVPKLETLWLSNDRKHKDFQQISCSSRLKEVTLLNCGVQSLHGIDRHKGLESLSLHYLRSLRDISALNSIADTLKLLSIENCPRLSDFSALYNLIKLEHLHLYGGNDIPKLDFLRNMTNLRTFCITMNVVDGDLGLCTNIPYVSCKDRKHYNMKDRDLPKKNTFP